MTSQNQANVKNSADAPNPYGGVGVQENGFGQTQGTDARAGQQQQDTSYDTQTQTQAQPQPAGDVGTGHHKHPSGFEHTPTHHGAGAAAGHYAGEDNLKAEPFPGAASGATGGCYGEQTAQPGKQQMQGSNFEGVPCTATWDTQRAQPGSGPQRDPPESKGMSGGGAQTGREGAEQAGAGGEERGGAVYEGTGMAAHGAQTGREGAEQAGTTAAGEEGRGGAVYGGTGMTAGHGTGSTGMKGVVSGVHGAGDAVRGKVMQGVNEVFGDEAGVKKNRGIAEAGMQEMRLGFGGRGGAKGHGDDVGGGTGTGAGGEGGNAKGDTAQGGTGLREVRY